MSKSMLTVAIALAAILSLSLFAHAFAAEENNNDRITKVEDKKTGTVGIGVKEAPGPKPIKKDNRSLD